jgi:hypothetical protein
MTLNNDQNENEEWRPIKELEGKYEVSSLGRIRSLKRLVTQRHPSGVNMTRWYGGEIVKPCGDPYLHVHLGAYRRGVRVHVLVAEHFLGPRPASNWVVDHINGDKKDNRACNLQWLTPRENCYIKPQRKHGKDGRFMKIST